MPVKTEREYRAMGLMQTSQQKRLDSDAYVEGYATTFNDPYVMGERDGMKYYEMIDRSALDGADFHDVIMQYDHSGRVRARTSNKTLGIEPDERGLFVYADLSKSGAARELYEDISSGLITKMSWAFTVDEDEYDKSSRTRVIKRIKKIYDVSAVSIPANPGTDISARSYFDGVIEEELQELQQRQSELELARKRYEYIGVI
ncbi:MAG: HK97 family phage prohead protease [Christensenellales bacterium]